MFYKYWPFPKPPAQQPFPSPLSPSDHAPNHTVPSPGVTKDHGGNTNTQLIVPDLETETWKNSKRGGHEAPRTMGMHSSLGKHPGDDGHPSKPAWIKGKKKLFIPMLSQRELVEAGWQWEGISTGAKPGAATTAASQVWVGSIASRDRTHCCPLNSLEIQGEGHSGDPPQSSLFPGVVLGGYWS